MLPPRHHITARTSGTQDDVFQLALHIRAFFNDLGRVLLLGGFLALLNIIRLIIHVGFCPVEINCFVLRTRDNIRKVQNGLMTRGIQKKLYLNKSYYIDIHVQPLCAKLLWRTLVFLSHVLLVTVTKYSIRYDLNNDNNFQI